MNPKCLHIKAQGTLLGLSFAASAASSAKGNSELVQIPKAELQFLSSAEGGLSFFSVEIPHQGSLSALTMRTAAIGNSPQNTHPTPIIPNTAEILLKEGVCGTGTATARLYSPRGQILSEVSASEGTIHLQLARHNYLTTSGAFEILQIPGSGTDVYRQLTPGNYLVVVKSHENSRECVFQFKVNPAFAQ